MLKGRSILNLIRRRHTRAQGVHELRKLIKRLRSALSLFKNALSKSDYIKADDSLRNLGKALGPSRDLDVESILIEELQKENWDSKLLTAASQQITEERKALKIPSNKIIEKSFGLVKNRLNAFNDRYLDNAFIDDGLKKACKRAKKAFYRAKKTESEDDFHDLRKSVKRVTHQVTLIKEANHKIKFDNLELWEELSDLLGEQHDISVLKTRIDPIAKDSNRLMKELDRRCYQLGKKAIHIGKSTGL